MMMKTQNEDKSGQREETRKLKMEWKNKSRETKEKTNNLMFIKGLLSTEKVRQEEK